MPPAGFFDWGFAASILPMLVRAALVTVEATLGGFVLAAVLGLGLAGLRAVPSRWVAWPAAGFAEFVRSTPLLVQLFFVFFVLPRYGVVLSPLTAGILTLGVHYATYCAEVYRAGFEGVPRGQWEAATALNLGIWDTLKNVVLPQAIPPVVPALGNYLIALFKETPQLAAIAVTELMLTAFQIGSENFRYIEAVTLVGLFFLAMSVVSAFGVRRLERWLGRP